MVQLFGMKSFEIVHAEEVYIRATLKTLFERISLTDIQPGLSHQYFQLLSR